MTQRIIQRTPRNQQEKRVSSLIQKWGELLLEEPFQLSHKHMKTCTNSVIGKGKLKPQCGVISHPLEGWKSKSCSIPMPDVGQTGSLSCRWCKPVSCLGMPMEVETLWRKTQEWVTQNSAWQLSLRESKEKMRIIT